MRERIGLFHSRHQRHLCRHGRQREDGRVRIAVKADGPGPQRPQHDVLRKALTRIEHVGPHRARLERPLAHRQQALALTDVHRDRDHLGLACEPGNRAERGCIARMGEHHPLL